MLYTLYCAAGIGAGVRLQRVDRIGAQVVHRSAAGWRLGIMAAGFGGGTALFIPFISSTIANSGYQSAFVATGIFQGVVIVIVAPGPAASRIDVRRGQWRRAVKRDLRMGRSSRRSRC